MSLYKPRLKQYQPYRLSDFVEEKDYFGKVGTFKINCGLLDGMSIANALRRNILTKSVGYSVVAYKIAGADSPFSTVTGLNFPVNLIVDNISKIQFSIKGDEDFLIASVQKTVPYTGLITAGMFASDAIEVHNPDLEIFYVSGVPVDISLGVGIGYGYISEVDQRSHFENTEGWFVKDAVFNPVTKVSYVCSSQGSEDVIEMKIHAYPNCSLIDLFESAKRDLSYIFGIIDEVDDTSNLTDEDVQCEQFLGIDIDSCSELSVRTRNALKSGGVNDLRLLLSFTPSSLISKVSGIGQRSIEDVGNFLSKYITDAQFNSLKRHCDDRVVRNIELYLQNTKSSYLEGEEEETEDE